jgi:hypothetical protein
MQTCYGKVGLLLTYRLFEIFVVVIANSCYAMLVVCKQQFDEKII